MYAAVPGRRPLVAITGPLEDERELFSWAFERAGFDTLLLPSVSPTELVSRIAAAAPDVILHRTQPQHSGTALLLGVRSHPKTAAIPIVIVTTDLRTRAQAAARAAGATDILILPMAPMDVMERVARVLACVNVT